MKQDNADVRSKWQEAVAETESLREENEVLNEELIDREPGVNAVAPPTYQESKSFDMEEEIQTLKAGLETAKEELAAESRRGRRETQSFLDKQVVMENEHAETVQTLKRELTEFKMIGFKITDKTRVVLDTEADVSANVAETSDDSGNSGVIGETPNANDQELLQEISSLKNQVTGLQNDLSELQLVHLALEVKSQGFSDNAEKLKMSQFTVDRHSQELLTKQRKLDALKNVGAEKAALETKVLKLESDMQSNVSTSMTLAKENDTLRAQLAAETKSREASENQDDQRLEKLKATMDLCQETAGNLLNLATTDLKTAEKKIIDNSVKSMTGDLVGFKFSTYVLGNIRKAATRGNKRGTSKQSSQPTKAPSKVVATRVEESTPKRTVATARKRLVKETPALVDSEKTLSPMEITNPNMEIDSTVPDISSVESGEPEISSLTGWSMDMLVGDEESPPLKKKCVERGNNENTKKGGK